MITPISHALNPLYDHRVAGPSVRRATAQRQADRVLGRSWLNTVKVITDLRVSAVPVRTASSTRLVRRRGQ